MRLPTPLAAWCIAKASSLLYASLRITDTNRALLEGYAVQGQSAIIAMWHDEMFCMSHACQGLPFVVLASMSKDADLISEIMRQKGIHTVRGSSSRGGSGALVSLIRHIEQEHRLVTIVADGPRGPRHQTKPGPVYLAHKTGMPLVPVRAIARNAWRLGSWDRFQIPKPFSRIELKVGEPYHITHQQLTPDLVAGECALLNQRMHDLGQD